MLELLWAGLQRLLVVAPMVVSTQFWHQDRNVNHLQLLLEHFPFEEDRKILSVSRFICEPMGSLRGFKLINQSTDIELNLCLVLETLQSACNGKETRGRAALPPAIAQGCPPWLGNWPVSSIRQPPLVFFTKLAWWTALVMCRHGLRRGTSISFRVLANLIVPDSFMRNTARPNPVNHHLLPSLRAAPEELGVQGHVLGHLRFSKRSAGKGEKRWGRRVFIGHPSLWVLPKVLRMGEPWERTGGSLSDSGWAR